MSLVEDILSTILTDYHTSYREMRRMLYGGFQKNRPSSQTPSQETISATIWRLKKQGFIHENKPKITKKGTSYFKEKQNNILRHTPYSNLKEDELKIIIFDIPETQKRKREWLRIELTALEFRQLQKSVWMGKTALPQEFVQSLHRLNLLPFIHIFSVRKRGTLA